MRVGVTQQALRAVQADVAALNLFEGEKPGEGDLAEVDGALGGLLSRAVDLGEIEGKLHQILLLHTEGRLGSPRLLVVGAGKREEYTVERAGTMAGAASRYLRSRQARHVAFWLRGPIELRPAAEAAVAGFLMGAFDAGLLKTENRKKAETEELTIVAPGVAEADLAPATERGQILGEAANYARAVDGQPGNRMPPSAVVEEARKLAQATGLELEVLDRARMESLGMRCLLSVAQGSTQPPFLIVLRYRTQQAGAPTLGVAGKGVTFDSGGISIKPADGMRFMRYDKSGACTTLGIMQAVARLKPAVNVIGLAPVVENMPSGTASRPGDVVQTMRGKTVEIISTDAEGRMILADALWYAQQNEKVTHLVDLATLTGAVRVALGDICTGVMGAPTEWVDQVLVAARQAGEKMWPLPLFPEYREQLKSTVADMLNAGGRPAGTITGALFIKEFVDEKVPWAHLDIAATAYTEKDLAFMAEGPTAAGLRTVIKLIEGLEGKGEGKQG